MSSLAAAGVRCDQGRRMSHWRLYLWVHTQPHRPRARPGAGPQAPWPLCPARTHLGPSAGPRTHGIGVAVPKAMPSLTGKGLGGSLSSRLQSSRSSLPRAGFHRVTSVLSLATSRGLHTGLLSTEPARLLCRALCSHVCAFPVIIFMPFCAVCVVLTYCGASSVCLRCSASSGKARL